MKTLTLTVNDDSKFNFLISLLRGLRFVRIEDELPADHIKATSKDERLCRQHSNILICSFLENEQRRHDAAVRFLSSLLGKESKEPLPTQKLQVKHIQALSSGRR